MKSLKDFYDDTSSLWAEEWYKNDENIPYLKEFLSCLKPTPKVLDLCCGAGYESKRLAQLGAEVVGIDFSTKSLDIAKKCNPQLQFFERDILKSYSDIGKFDGIICIGVLVHFEINKLKFLFKNMYDCLNKNGIILIVTKIGKKIQKASFFNGEKYKRNFIYHSLENIIKKSKKYFKFKKQLDKKDDWGYYLFERL